MPTAAPAPPAARPGTPAVAPAAAAPSADGKRRGAAPVMPLPPHAQDLAAEHGVEALRFLHPVTGRVLRLYPEEVVVDPEIDDGEPLPTRAEVEERMGQTFGEALREAIAEHEANPDAAVPWEQAQREVRAELDRRRAARDRAARDRQTA